MHSQTTNILAAAFHSLGLSLVPVQNLRPAPSTTPLLTRRPHRLLTTQAFRSDDVNAARSASTVRLQPQARPAGMYHADMDPQPLWKKPSFPFVVAIALATLPYDLASQHIHPRHSKARSSATSTSSGTSEPRRHAKAAGHSPAVSTPAPAPRDITAVKREAAAAAAAAGQGSQHQRPHSSSTSQTRKPSTSHHSEPWPLAAVGSGGMGVPAHPVDSWDSGDAGVSGFSDDEAEQQAKAMVIELLTHPKVLILSLWSTAHNAQPQRRCPHVCAYDHPCLAIHVGLPKCDSACALSAGTYIRTQRRYIT